MQSVGDVYVLFSYLQFVLSLFPSFPFFFFYSSVISDESACAFKRTLLFKKKKHLFHEYLEHIYLFITKLMREVSLEGLGFISLLFREFFPQIDARTFKILRESETFRSSPSSRAFATSKWKSLKYLIMLNKIFNWLWESRNWTFYAEIMRKTRICVYLELSLLCVRKIPETYNNSIMRYKNIYHVCNIFFNDDKVNFVRLPQQWT